MSRKVYVVGVGMTKYSSTRGDVSMPGLVREAAMAETDPVLKEKLWEEYRRYKGK